MTATIEPTTTQQASPFAGGKPGIIHTEELVKVYGDNRAVDGVSFDVREGEIFGFLGPNGAGKSTTIKMLITLVKPSGGKASVVGYDLNTQTTEIRRVIGYVAQEVGVDYRSTGRENLELQGRLYNMDTATIRRRTDELLEMVDLTNEGNKLAGTYSGGMRKRLDIATGLIHTPRLLFLDEPTTGLDPQTRSNLWEYIRKLNKEQGLTIFLTTHYLEEADRLCDRIAIIDHGKIKAIDTPATLKAQVSGDVVSLSFDRLEVPGDPARTETARQLLQAQEWVRDIQTTDNGGLTIYVNVGDQAMPEIIRLLDQNNILVATIAMSRPSLDDVFLKYTGRQMRDEADQQIKLQFGPSRRPMGGPGGRGSR